MFAILDGLFTIDSFAKVKVKRSSLLFWEFWLVHILKAKLYHLEFDWPTLSPYGKHYPPPVEQRSMFNLCIRRR